MPPKEGRKERYFANKRFKFFSWCRMLPLFVHSKLFVLPPYVLPVKSTRIGIRPFIFVEGNVANYVASSLVMRLKEKGLF